MSLVNSIIHITTECNSRCITCDFWKKEKQLLSLSTVVDIIDQISKSDISQVMISGGEPLLHPNILEITQYIKNKEINVMLNTNGIIIGKLIKDKKIESLVKNVDVFVISLDASCSEIYKKIRGINAYDIVINNILSLKKYIENLPYYNIKPEVTLRCTIQKHNLLDIPNIANLATKLGCDLGLNPIDAITDNFGRDFLNIKKNELIPDKNDIENFLTLMDTNKIFKDKLNSIKYNVSWNKDKFMDLLNYFEKINGIKSIDTKKNSACIIPYTNLIFEANGDVKVCFYEKISNIYKEHNIKKFFNLNSISNAVQNLEKNGKCINCRCKIFC